MPDQIDVRADGEVDDAAHRPAAVPFAEALRFWIKLGFISFGGPAGQIAIMHRECVERKGWLSNERFLHALNYCMLLPGPEAQQLAIYIGWLMHRTWGGIVAGVFFVLPSVFILLGLSYIYVAYGSMPVIAGVLEGFKPIVVAIVVEAIFKIGGKALGGSAHFVIAAAAFIFIYFLGVPFPLIVIGAAIVGVVGARLAPQRFLIKKKPPIAFDESAQAPRRTVIDDDGPAPAHTRPNSRRVVVVLAVGLLLWFVPLVALGSWLGFGSLHVREYTFFTQAALVTFGGAYAVLAYATQALTAAPYNWLTPGQAVDGLALAETTPGPLIMVLQFIGFIAGWNNPGTMDPAAAAVLGALVTTYVTFLPCFAFIFVGAPYIEVLRGNKFLNGALSGVTAAVVGVILNLVLVFGTAVIFPAGFAASPDVFALLLAAVAFVALYKLKVNVLTVILAGGAIGLLRVLLTA
ncbi:MAG: chromate efflux transporter [Blastocatellia bacterium]|nr:chromate efflux transporter [Blastocatellia bacterium]